MITCPSCKHSFSELDQPCKKCSGTRFIKIPVYEKLTAALKTAGITTRRQIGEKEVICTRCNGNGTEVSAANRNNRKRGAANEYKAVDIFTDWWVGPNGEKYEFRKTPQSGGSALAEGFDMAGDLCTTAPDFKMHIECKRTDAWDFGQLLNKQHEGYAAYGAMGEYFEQIFLDVPKRQDDSYRWAKIPMLWLMHPGPSQPTYIMVFAQNINSTTPIIDRHYGMLRGSSCYRMSNGKFEYPLYWIMGLKHFLGIGPMKWRELIEDMLWKPTT